MDDSLFGVKVTESGSELDEYLPNYGLFDALLFLTLGNDVVGEGVSV